MNSLPQLSQTLFAAAVGTEESTPRRPERQAAGSPTLPGIATAIPLELLAAAEEVLPPATRTLPTVVVADS